MLDVGIRRVRRGQEEQLRAWFNELSRRQDEVRETYAQKGARHEKVFLIRRAEESFLVYAMEVEDIERGHEAYKNSTLPIDHEHRRVMSDALENADCSELLYECHV